MKERAIRYLTVSELGTETGYTSRHIRRLVADGKFGTLVKRTSGGHCRFLDGHELRHLVLELRGLKVAGTTAPSDVYAKLSGRARGKRVPVKSPTDPNVVLIAYQKWNRDCGMALTETDKTEAFFDEVEKAFRPIVDHFESLPKLRKFWRKLSNNRRVNAR